MKGLKILGLAVVAVAAFWVGSNLGEVQLTDSVRTSAAVEEHAEQVPLSGKEVKAHTGAKKVTIYRADEDGAQLIADTYTVERTNETIAQAMGLLSEDPMKNGLYGTLPEGAKVNSIRFAQHVAYIDFSPELKRNFHGGSAAELMLVGSIVNTLTEIPGVKKVKITVNGHTVESIGGHCDVSVPLERMPELLKK